MEKSVIKNPEHMTSNQIEQILNKTTDLEEAKKCCKMLIPELTEEEVQRMAEEIISIK